MRYLLDTSIVSAFAPGNERLPSDWIAHLQASPRSVFMSVISVFEIEQGIEKLVRTGATMKARLLGRWLGETLSEFGDNTLAVDTELARRTGRNSDRAFAIGRHPGLADVMIGTTAEMHRLVLLTRNLRHFEPLGIDAVDPFTSRPV